jgi:hypothetical protein
MQWTQERHALRERDTVERTRRSDREYDGRMRKPPITCDAFIAALAVLATSSGCSRAERAGAEPASATPSTATATATTSATTSATPAAQATAAPSAPDPAAAIDAGVEHTPAAPSTKPTKGGSAACGATGCSAEMRKGGK